ncbi:DUF4163 domain-containing protein [Clostridiaceae bacterium]|nr:DUF4163 domain-containing protein [Clostridiaceae bacterium]RKI11485.1 DUF4163 domain-containing protein [bacterium 1XD21-70]
MMKPFPGSHSHKTAALCALALLTAALAAGCKKSPEKVDLTSTHTTAAETMASQEETSKETDATKAQAPEDSQPQETEKGQAGSKKISTRNNTYSSGKVSITYPGIVNLEDAEKASAVNELLKKNALSVLEAWEINDTEDSLDISCQVLSADRNRVTVVYTGELAKKGAAYPTKVMYSNTVDVPNASDIGFDHFADPYTMAGYVLSGDCTFYNASDALKSELMGVKNDTSLEAYTEMFTNADFPFEGTFPQSFSYEHQGVIYFTVPVPHALGDYAVVMFAPDSK